MVPNWLARSETVSPQAKVVFLVMASHCGKYGTYEIAHSVIAREANLSLATVKRALVELRALQVMTWLSSARLPNGQGNVYQLRVWPPREES